MTRMAKVKIYTTTVCPYCRMAKDFFTKNNVEYEEHNVALDESKLHEMVQKSHQWGVPVIDVEGQIIVGFNRGELEKALKVA